MAPKWAANQRRGWSRQAFAAKGGLLTRVHATVRYEVAEPGVGAGEAKGREDAFVEGPAGWAVEIGTGGNEASGAIGSGDAGDDLFGPLPRPEDLRLGSHDQGGNARPAVRMRPTGVDRTGVNAQDKTRLGVRSAWLTGRIGWPEGKWPMGALGFISDDIDGIDGIVEGEAGDSMFNGF